MTHITTLKNFFPAHTFGAVVLPSLLALFCYEGRNVTPLPAILEMADSGLETARREGRRPEIAIFVGSEGGFSSEEAAAAREAGFAMTGLGKRILRTETASGFVLSCLIYALEL